MIRIFKHFISRWSLLLIFLESAAFFDAGYLGVALRFWKQTAADDIHQDGLFIKVLFFTTVMVGSMTATGRYQRLMDEGFVGESLRVLLSFIIGVIALTSVFYVFPNLFIGRGAFALALGFALFIVVIIRLLFYRYLLDKEVLKRRVLVFGAGERARIIERDEYASEEKDYVIAGYWPTADETPTVAPEAVIPNTVDLDLCQYIRDQGIQEVVLAAGGAALSWEAKSLLDCKMSGVQVLDLSSFYEQEHRVIRVDVMPPVWWLLHSEGVHSSSFRDVTKKIFDVLVSLLLLLVTWPLMLLAACAIFIECGGRGPIFYRQKRVGYGGRIIEVLKFRSMYTDAEQDGVARWAKVHDDRITHVGRFIRKTRIDELPQAINVLKGEMSLVGPRPERPEFVQELSKTIPFYSERLRVKPGITGWAQIRYGYSASTEDAIQKLMFDLYYVKNHSFFLDVLILVQSIEVVLFGWGAEAPGKR